MSNHTNLSNSAPDEFNDSDEDEPPSKVDLFQVLQETADILHNVITEAALSSSSRKESVEHVSPLNVQATTALPVLGSSTMFISDNVGEEDGEFDKSMDLLAEITEIEKTIIQACDPDPIEPRRYKVVEPTVSTLEREILLRGDSAEKRAKILQLPSSTISNTPSHCEKEIMGDDPAKNRMHILCECELPGVAGAAVPVVTSFIEPVKENNQERSQQESGGNRLKPSLIPKLSSSFRNEKLGSDGMTHKRHSNQHEREKNVRNLCFHESPTKEPNFASMDDCTAVNEESLQPLVASEGDDEIQRRKRYRKLTSEFSKNVSGLAEETANLSNVGNPEAQMAAVDDLYKRVINLRKITNELKLFKSRPNYEPVISKDTNSEENTTKPPTNNKIYIKFLPSKATIKKKKNCNSEVQTDFESSDAAGGPKEEEVIVQGVPISEQANLNEVDSMDGMFIPSLDDPPDIDDDDEEGLDITITFPELQKTSNQDDSHLSVCFSNISAEALGCLKRCPKEFTLRMDFVQGKMFFQSARSAANNYSIGPDLKITECTIDSRKSDIISIKPSTECLFTSQIIPVEGAQRADSIKILKSTDSELFNVVSLPYVVKRNSVATASCISFRNARNKGSGESLLGDRTYYQSMPQIPSLTRILEEPTENGHCGTMRGDDLDVAIKKAKKAEYLDSLSSSQEEFTDKRIIKSSGHKTNKLELSAEDRALLQNIETNFALLNTKVDFAIECLNALMKRSTTKELLSTQKKNDELLLILNLLPLSNENALGQIETWLNKNMANAHDLATKLSLIGGSSLKNLFEK